MEELTFYLGAIWNLFVAIVLIYTFARVVAVPFEFTRKVYRKLLK